jgi:alkylation response protein AidB-like acyl-CoA dehydrogenase
MIMDFTPTQAQRALSTLTGQIVHDRADTEQLRRLDLTLVDGGDRFDQKLWDVLAETGVLGAALPRTAGGDGHGLLEQCSVLIELGRALAPVPYLPTIAMAGSALAQFGTPQQQADWLKPALGGQQVLTVALLEPDGSDPLTPSTRAEPTPTGWSLTGTKTTVLAGGLAHVILVSATTPDGPELFAVTPNDAGVRISRQQMIDHDDAGWLELVDVQLPADRRIGPADRTSATGSVAWVLRHGTVALCAQQLGVLERALELTAEYATTRKQFERPIGTFQAVAQRLADAYIQVQALRLAMWNAAWLLDSGPPDDTAPNDDSLLSDDAVPSDDAVLSAVATAKFWAAEAGHYVSHTCVHVHGGAGIDVEHQLHRYFLAAKRAEFELGGATAQLRTLGHLLARP